MKVIKFGSLFLGLFLFSITLTKCIAEEQRSQEPTSYPANKNYSQPIKNTKLDVANDKNLIDNGDFENFNPQAAAFDGWANWGRKSKFSLAVDPASGNKSLKASLSDEIKSAPDAVRCLIVYQINLFPGTYSFSCSYKGKNLTDIRVRLYPASGEPSQSGAKTVSLKGQNTENWKELNTLLSTPENTGGSKITIEFIGKKGEENEGFLDNVKLVKQSAMANVEGR